MCNIIKYRVSYNIDYIIHVYFLNTHIFYEFHYIFVDKIHYVCNIVLAKYIKVLSLIDFSTNREVQK